MDAQPFCLVEQSDFVVRLAAGVREERKLRLDALHEVIPGTPGAEQALKALSAKAGAAWTCALRPKAQRLHLASAAEAAQHAGAAGIQQWLRSPAAGMDGSAWCAAADAATGRPPAGARWVTLAVASEAYQQAVAAFVGVGSPKPGTLAASLLTVGAVAATTEAAVLVLELGEASSFALVVDRSGIRGAVQISMHRPTVAEAVQAELGLKFRGAADKLFFNPDYDFGDVAGKIAHRLLTALKSEVGPLLAEFKPSALFCSSLGSRQQWLPAQLGTALGLAPFSPDIKSWSANAGIQFADPALEAAASCLWLPTLRSLHAQGAASPANWQVEWRSVESLASGTAAPAASTVKPTEPAKPATTPAAAPVKSKAPAAVTTAAPKPASPEIPRTIPPTPAPSAAPKPEPAKPSAPAKKPAVEPFPLVRPPAEPVRAAAAKPESSSSSVAYPAKPADPKDPSPAASKAPAAAVGANAAPKSPASGAQRQKMIIIAVAAVVVLAVFAGLFFNSRSNAAALAAEKQKTEQRLKAEQERAQLAEQRAREAAEARGKTERELSEKLKAAEQARAEAQKEALTQAAARLANARGSVTIVTEPAGARIALGTLPPRTSPANFTDIKTGRYEAVITLAGYDEARLTVEVLENATANPAPVALVRALGALEIATQPAGVDYEVKPANVLMVAPDARRTGRTPAKIDDLTPGDYVVTLTRDGWAPHTETVSVARAGTARVSWALQTGQLRLTSTPTGATVLRKGQEIGVTPLELTEQPAGAVEFELHRPEYDKPVVVKGEIQPGEVLTLAGGFLPADRIYTAGEFDREPEPSNNKPPALPYYLTLEKGRIEIELVVMSDGTTKAYRVRQTTNPDYTKYCLDALKTWKFKPAMAKGRAVNARIVVPFTFKGSNG